MTLWDDVKNDKDAQKCLDHGFVVLRDHMGSDSTIVESARVSYGKGTKKVSEDRGLIRYLLRHKHTTPFEMVEFRFLVKLPIFVARQWIRHRTANVNEYSGRYSEMSNEFYIPEAADCAPQSSGNKQGREGNLSDKEIEGVQWLIDAANSHSYDTYNALLGKFNNNQIEAPYDIYNEDAWFDDNYPGLARELSRMVLPLNNYTEWYWKIDLHNLFRFLSLRNDPHAQKEIQIYAQAIEELITPYIPLAMEAYNDFIKGSMSLSRMEVKIVKLALQNNGLNVIQNFDIFAKNSGMSKREIREFKERWGI